MSRFTSQDIIDSGNYLEDDFDPNTLVVANLRAILNYHDVSVGSAAKKDKLLQEFRDNIYTRRAEFKRQKSDMEGSQASAVGIHDGHTGKHLGSPEVSVSGLTKKTP